MLLRVNALRRICAILAVLFIAIASASLIAAPPAGGSSLATVYQLPFRVASPMARTDLENEVLILVNRDRVRAGLSPLLRDLILRGAARRHGTDMFTYGYLSHTARNGSTPMQRALQAGAHARLFGENLAYAASAAKAHENLMGSPGHRANILSRSFHRLGIGVLDGGEYGVIVVENFTD